MPDFRAYHRSISQELSSLQNRIRNLVTHWPTDGELKEAILRNVIRRHLPESLLIGRGFIVSDTESSTQLDLLLIDSNKPTLFKDDSLFVVTPDAVRAIIEVKTRLPSAGKFNECAGKLAAAGKLCHDVVGKTPWLGIFCYEQGVASYETPLDAVEHGYKESNTKINCIAEGASKFVRFWAKTERESGDGDAMKNSEGWRAYNLGQLAPSYFIGNLIDSLSELSRRESSYAWYPIQNGKGQFRKGQRLVKRPPRKSK